MKLILEQKEFEVKGEGGNSWQNTSLWTSKKALMPIIKGHILDGSTVNTDRWKAY